MRPAFLAFIVGITAREQKNVPVKFVLITLSHSSLFISATDDAGNIAALLTKISMVPNARRVSATILFTEFSSETSVVIALAMFPAASMSLATVAPLSGLSSAITIFAP